MSFKYAASKISDGHYVLPRVGQMKVEAHAFLSDSLYAASEEGMWDQLASSASYEGVIGTYAMPDCHFGFGIPVGCVVVTDKTIIQAGSGYDISCGVVYAKVPGLTAEKVKDRYPRERLVREIEKRVPTGKGSDRPKLAPKFSNRDRDEVLRWGAKALRINADLCERQYIDVPSDTDFSKIEAAYDKVVPQLGSVGGGNHFIEIQCDRDTGEVYAMIHCGSRGYGWQVANHFFYAGARERGLPMARREESFLYRDEALGKQYWAYHNSAANFAVANRHIIVEGVRQAFQEVYNVDIELFYEISHNLVQEETVTLPDGTSIRGFVHRKGATRAFPARHPDLVGTKWESTGHPCLIPGSMYDGAAILYAEPGAAQSGYSVNHGSGRTMARGAAKKRLGPSQDAINSEMREVVRTFGGVEIKGIVTNHKDVPLDECSHVYKQLDEVLEVLTTTGIARVASRLYPLANIKAQE